MVTFLAVFYTLICEGFVLGILMDNGEIPCVTKIIMILFAIVITPIFFGIAIGRIIIEAQPK